MRRWPLAIIAGLAIALLIGRAVAGLYADYLWYDAMHAVPLWRDRTLGIFALRVGSGLVAACFVFANLYAVRHSVVSLVLPRRVANLEIGEEVPGRYLVAAAIVLAVALGWLLALPADSWASFALLRHGLPFGEGDPYFEADLSFFVYVLPFENELYFAALLAVLLVIAVVVFLYALTPSLRWERGTLYVSNYVRRHLVVLAALLLLLLAWSYHLDIYRTLLEGSGENGAFTFSDHHALIPVRILLAFLTAGAAFVVLFSGWGGQVRVAALTIATLLLLSFLLRELAPPFVRHYSAISDPQARERQYLRTRALYSRHAYGVDAIADSAPAFAAARDLVTAVPAWDPVALARAGAHATRNATTVDALGWQVMPAGIVATVLSRPGALSDLASDGAPGWSVERVLAATADVSGDPADAPRPADTRDEPALARVLVADTTAPYAIVSDSSGTIVAPTLGSTLARLAFAWSLQNVHLLSHEPAADARIITRRDVRERVHALAPFFEQGSTALPVVVGDTLWWCLELYSASPWYPLSERVTFDGETYGSVRHAATAIVAAQSGRTLLIPDARRDSMTESWIQAYPELFTTWAAVPPPLIAQLPPMLDEGRIQAEILARYGTGAEAPPLGHLPGVTADSLVASDVPVLLASPGNRTLLWTTPLLDQNEHVVAIAVATGGAARGTEWRRLAEPGPRWSTITGDLRRALDSTSDVGREARLVRGEVRAMLVGDSAAYVQPAYAWSTDHVSLVRMAARTERGLTTGRTLAAALGTGPAAHDTTTGDFRARVMALYARMRAALQRGDWAAFGRAYDELGALLQSSEH